MKPTYRNVNFWIIYKNNVVLCGYAPTLEFAQRQARSYVKASQTAAKVGGIIIKKVEFKLKYKGINRNHTTTAI